MENLDFGRKIVTPSKKESSPSEPKPVWERITDEAVSILQAESPELLENFGEAKIRETAKDFIQAMRESWSMDLANADAENVADVEKGKARSLADNIKEKLLN